MAWSRHQIAAGDLLVVAIVQLAHWRFTLFGSIVVRHTVRFLVTAYFALVLVCHLHISDHVVFENLVPDVMYKLNRSAAIGDHCYAY